MRKTIVSLLLSCALLCCWGFGVHAESLQGKSGMKVTFNGSSMKANYKTADLTKTAVNMLPGDSVTCEVRLENASDSVASVYLSNSVRKSMEDKGSGGAYTYDLRYLGDDGTETVIYNSASVGGEGSKGLSGAVENLGGRGDDSYVFLGSQNGGSGGTVRLTITLDGETQGNDYQDSLADLRMQFAAVKGARSADNGTTPSGNQNGGDNGGNGRTARPVKTGDETELYPYYLAAGISGVLLLFLFFFRRKKEEEEEEA